MPAADITEVKVTFHDERRGPFEYNPPIRKAEVSLYATVPAGADPAVALEYISRLAQDKVKSLLLSTAGAPQVDLEAKFPPISAGSPASQSEDAATPGEPQRRTRRTKAEMEAARAAETEVDGAPAEPEPSTNAAEAAPEATASEVVDEWDVGAADAPTITDLELNHSCSETAGRTKKPLDVKALIGTFAPATDEFNVEKGGKKFTVNDIPQNQRADFIAKLKALT